MNHEPATIPDVMKYFTRSTVPAFPRRISVSLTGLEYTADYNLGNEPEYPDVRPRISFVDKSPASSLVLVASAKLLCKEQP
jgi:hypothetical protein